MALFSVSSPSYLAKSASHAGACSGLVVWVILLVLCLGNVRPDLHRRWLKTFPEGVLLLLGECMNRMNP